VASPIAVHAWVFSRGGRRNPPKGIYLNTGNSEHGGSALAGGCAGGPGARDVRGGDGAAARAAARARVPHAARPCEEPAGLLLLRVLPVPVRPRPCASACPALPCKEPAGPLLLRILPAPARPRPCARQAAPARRARAACTVRALRRALSSRDERVLCRAACAQGTGPAGRRARGPGCSRRCARSRWARTCARTRSAPRSAWAWPPSRAATWPSAGSCCRRRARRYGMHASAACCGRGGDVSTLRCGDGGATNKAILSRRMRGLPVRGSWPARAVPHPHLHRLHQHQLAARVPAQHAPGALPGPPQAAHVWRLHAHHTAGWRMLPACGAWRLALVWNLGEHASLSRMLRWGPADLGAHLVRALLSASARKCAADVVAHLVCSHKLTQLVCVCFLPQLESALARAAVLRGVGRGQQHHAGPHPDRADRLLRAVHRPAPAQAAAAKVQARPAVLTCTLTELELYRVLSSSLKYRSATACCETHVRCFRAYHAHRCADAASLEVLSAVVTLLHGGMNRQYFY